MPYPVWRHLCRGREVGSGEPVCPDCGAVSFFDGWALRIQEAMGQYQHIHGLAPVGPHRRMADRLFQHSRRCCHACAGSGLASLSERAWSLCRHCEGTGGLWRIPPRRVEEIRGEILKAFPEAGAPSDFRFLSGGRSRTWVREEFTFADG